MIPRDASWCTICRCPEVYGDGPCTAHRGPDGQARPYEGPDAYDPTSWVLSIVGGRYRAPRWDQGVSRVVTYVCDGYDPRSGFWMRDLSDGYQTNVSERAIDRTYHREVSRPGVSDG